jgi:hypothetical protein
MACHSERSEEFTRGIDALARSGDSIGFFAALRMTGLENPRVNLSL